MSAGALSRTAGPPAGQVTAMVQRVNDGRPSRRSTTAGSGSWGRSGRDHVNWECLGTGLAGDKVDDEALLACAQHPDLACVDLEDRGRLEFGKLAGQLRALRLKLGERLLLGAQGTLGRKVPAQRPDIAQSDCREQACDDDRAWTRRERAPERRAGRRGPPYVLGTPRGRRSFSRGCPIDPAFVGALSHPLRASARRTRPRRSMSPQGPAAPRSAATGCIWPRARCATAPRS